jgi:hypothetical protein
MGGHGVASLARTRAHTHTHTDTRRERASGALPRGEERSARGRVTRPARTHTDSLGGLDARDLLLLSERSGQWECECECESGAAAQRVRCHRRDGPAERDGEGAVLREGGAQAGEVDDGGGPDTRQLHCRARRGILEVAAQECR